MVFKKNLKKVFPSFITDFPSDMLQKIRFNLLMKGRKIKMDYKDEDIFLYVDSMRESSSRVNSAKGEPDTIEWIRNNIKQDDTLFDIGANVGTYSLIAAKTKKCKVYSFEPMTLNFYKLTQNVKLNELNEYIIPVNIALSDKNTIDKFNLSSTEAGSARHAFGTTKDQENEDFTPIYFQYQISFRLDSFIEFYNLPTPNHIKIDVDGIESLILKGAERTLKNFNLKTVLVEVNTKHDAPEIMKIMNKNNFILKGERHIQDNSYNYIFVRKNLEVH